jgi:3-methyladenine DNA glycosylase AlkD
MPTHSGLETGAVAAEVIAGIHGLPDRKTATVRAFRRGCSKKLTVAEPSAVLKIARRLLRERDFLFRFVAYELIAHHRVALRSLAAKDLKQLGEGIDSWFAVDTFACYLSGPAWREKQVPDKLIHGWTRSRDRWWRRAALVSTVPLNNKARGGRGDAERTLTVCRMLVHDTDDMVVKALSWALRELAKRDPKAVHEFLTNHANLLAKRVLREVRNKLITGLKNPRGK